MINLVCDKAMLSSYASDRPEIERRTIELVARELHLRPSTGTKVRTKGTTTAQRSARPMSRWTHLRGPLAAAAITLLLMLLAAAGVIASRLYLASEKEHRTVSTRTKATAFCRMRPPDGSGLQIDGSAGV
ncbi:MAG: hypothetical protein JO166_24970 [Deltaproteobacteria bacterium]|nr:hypothetical protein [Deltaproteobacteria bacterium]